jgi:hypothetical protein
MRMRSAIVAVAIAVLGLGPGCFDYDFDYLDGETAGDTAGEATGEADGETGDRAAPTPGTTSDPTTDTATGTTTSDDTAPPDTGDLLVEPRGGTLYFTVGGPSSADFRDVTITNRSSSPRVVAAAMLSPYSDYDFTCFNCWNSVTPRTLAPGETVTVTIMLTQSEAPTGCLPKSGAMLIMPDVPDPAEDVTTSPYIQLTFDMEAPESLSIDGAPGSVRFAPAPGETTAGSGLTLRAGGGSARVKVCRVSGETDEIKLDTGAPRILGEGFEIPASGKQVQLDFNPTLGETPPSDEIRTRIIFRTLGGGVAAQIDATGYRP